MERSNGGVIYLALLRVTNQGIPRSDKPRNPQFEFPFFPYSVEFIDSRVLLAVRLVKSMDRPRIYKRTLDKHVAVSL